MARLVLDGIPDAQLEMTITVPEADGREPNDHSRFKIALQYANTVDLDSVMRFCKAERQSSQEQEIVVSFQALSRSHYS